MALISFKKGTNIGGMRKRTTSQSPIENMGSFKNDL